MLVRRMLWLFCTAACCALSSAAHGQSTLVVGDRPITVAQTMQNDASLAALAFIDRATGWAVGDRGVIWRTADGGQSWTQQQSGVTCRLSCVSFIDSQHGWIAGGEMQPLSNSSRGVLLTTSDGGQTWNELDQATLPTVRHMRFFDAQRGIAAGDSSATFPSGVFITKDGGRAWQPLPTDSTGNWLAADFPDSHSGAVAGAGGRFATLMRGRVANSSAAVDGMRAYRALRLVPPTNGWLVGDGGLIMTTRDLGSSWQTPPGELPDVVRENLDFHTVAVSGPQVWIAVRPARGSSARRTADTPGN